jgi:hypothetical protein
MSEVGPCALRREGADEFLHTRKGPLLLRGTYLGLWMMNINDWMAYGLLFSYDDVIVSIGLIIDNIYP